MNAWIDCMSDLSAPAHGLTKIRAPADDLLVQIDGAVDLKRRCPSHSMRSSSAPPSSMKGGKGSAQSPRSLCSATFPSRSARCPHHRAKIREP
jgi:hypothetical protein